MRKQANPAEAGTSYPYRKAKNCNAEGSTTPLLTGMGPGSIGAVNSKVLTKGGRARVQNSTSVHRQYVKYITVAD